MRFTKLATFSVVASLAVFGTLLVFAQGGNLFPTSEASSSYQGGESLTPAGESFTEAVEINAESSVAWSLTSGGGSGSTTPIIFTPNSNFSFSGLSAGVNSVAGVAFEAQATSSNLNLASAAAQVGSQFTAGVSALEVTMVSEATSGSPGEYLGELIGGGPGGDGPTLISFTFALNSADLSSLANGEQITVEANNNASAGPLYTLTEATITLAEDGQVFIAGFEFTE